MTLARRLTAVESAVDPTSRIVAWLAEAHTYGSFDHYTRAAMAGHRDDLPMNRLPREAAAAARAGAPRGSEDIDVRSAIRAVVFRIHLVLRIAEHTDAILKREQLLLALLTAHVGLAISLPPKEVRPGTLLRHRDALLLRVAELMAQAEARSFVERRYLGGHPALFPETRRQWDEQLHDSQEAGIMALRLAELDGAQPMDEALQLVPSQERIEAAVSELVEVPRIKTLDDTGDWRGAQARLRAWVG